jgi:hypothetical protein
MLLIKLGELHLLLFAENALLKLSVKLSEEWIKRGLSPPHNRQRKQTADDLKDETTLE